jgi:hypothetical protein
MRVRVGVHEDQTRKLAAAQRLVNGGGGPV